MDVDSFQRAFFDGTMTIADVYLDGDKNQTNGIPDLSDPTNPNGCEDAATDPGTDPDGIISTCGKEWHTIGISGFRNGGAALTALDLTNIECVPGSDTDNDTCASTIKRFTDGPDYPQHLWTFFDRQMGNTWSQPKVGRVRVNYDDISGDRWVVFGGGGYDPVFTDPVADDDGNGTINIEQTDADGNFEHRGNAFYVIDIATGKVIYKFDRNDDDKFVCDAPADPNVIDTNADGYVDLVYIGDKCGRMWRFDVSEPINAGVDAKDAGIGSVDPLLFADESTTAPDWDGDVVFCVNDASAVSNTCLDGSGALRKPQAGDLLFPIFFAPTTVLDNLGQRHVIFVTGDRAWPTNEDKFGKLYNFIDEYVPSFLAGGSPGPLTFKTESDIDGSGTDGATLILSGNGFEFIVTNATNPGDPAAGEFVVQFPNSQLSVDTDGDGIDDIEGGEKGVGTPVVISGVLIFTTFNPDTGAVDVCSAGLGTGRIFALDFITGVAALFRIPGAQGIIGSDKTIAGIRGGEGVPTPAQLSYSSKGTITMSLAFSGSGVSGGAQFLLWELPRLPATTQTLYWEEVIN